MKSNFSLFFFLLWIMILVSYPGTLCRTLGIEDFLLLFSESLLVVHLYLHLSSWLRFGNLQLSELVWFIKAVGFVCRIICRVPLLTFNLCGVCSDISFYSWYWLSVLSLFFSFCSVWLEVYQFYWPFQRINVCFIAFFFFFGFHIHYFLLLGFLPTCLCSSLCTFSR